MAVSDPKILFFLFNNKDIEKAIDIFGVEKLRESKCFALSTESLEELLKAKIISTEYESYFPKHLAMKLNITAKKWSKNWYKAARLKATVENINLLELMDLTLYNYFAKKLFQYFSIRELLLREKPKIIFIGKEQSSVINIFTSNYDLFTPVIEKSAKDLGIETKRLRGDYLSHKVFNIQLIKLFYSFLDNPSISGNHDNSRKAKYLFLGNHYHIKNILDLVNKFKEQSLVVGRVKEFSRDLARAGIRFIDVKNSLEIPLLIVYLINKFKLLIAFFLLDTRKLNSFFKFESYDFFDLFKLKIYSLFVRECSSLLVSLLQAKKVIKLIDPKLLINVTEDLYIRGFITHAKKIGLMTLEVEHGFTPGYDSEFTIVDKLAVWGNIPKTIYKETGFDERKMVITGWPAFEKYKNIKLGDKKIDQNNFTILFIAQDPEGASLLFMKNTPINSFKIFFEAVTNFKAAKIIVRLHPRADKKIPIVVSRKYKIKFEFSEIEELLDALEKSDIVIAQTTSATLDAIIMHKPVIYLPSMRWSVDFVEGSGAVFEVNNSRKIIDKIKQIVENGMDSKMIKAQNIFIEDYCNFSQNSVKKISELIYKMSENRQ